MIEKTRVLIWFNNGIIPLENAHINILSATAQYGINVFEGIRCYYNNDKGVLYAFRLGDHINRLFDSAKLLRLDFDAHISHDYIFQNLQEAIRANNFSQDLYVKVGLFLDSDGSWSNSGPIGLFIVPTPKERVFTDRIGVDCGVVSWGRISETNLPPRIKAGANYINSRFAHLEAVRHNYDLAIFMNQFGKIAEGTGACIFMVRNGKLVTPPITSSILESITRDTIIKIAHDTNYEVQEREIDRTELYLSDELFFVGTSVEVLPIKSVDGFNINNGIPGRLTTELKDKYFKIARQECVDYSKWTTIVK